MVEDNIKRLNELKGCRIIDVKTKDNEAYIFFSNGYEIYIDDKIAQEPFWIMQLTPKLNDAEQKDGE